VGSVPAGQTLTVSDSLISSGRRARPQEFEYSTLRETKADVPRLIPVRTWIGPPLQALAGAESRPRSSL
jgi:hypothetical protein